MKRRVRLNEEQADALLHAVGELNRLRVELGLPKTATASQVRVAVLDALRSKAALPEPASDHAEDTVSFGPVGVFE